MKNLTKMKDTYRRFRGYDSGSVTTPELGAMKEEIEAALPYLRGLPECGAVLKMAQEDLLRIDDYLFARKEAKRDHFRKTRRLPVSHY